MRITVLIKPNSKHREEVVQGDEGYMVFTKSPAIEGKANQAAIRLIAKHFRVSKGRVNLVRGHTSKRKVFEVDTD